MPARLNRREFLAAASLGSATLVASSLAVGGSTRIATTTVTYKTAGSLEIQLDVHRPDDDRVRPVVVWIHGGALIMGSRSGIDPRVKKEEGADFLKAGYAVVSIDYRLAPETKLPAIIEDVEDAYRFVHERGPELFHVDTERIAVLGSSAGGYLTLTCGFRAKPRPAALVSYWGYGDLIGDWYSRPSDFYRRQPLVSEEAALAGVSGPPVADGVVDGNDYPKARSAFYLYCRQNGLWPKLVGGLDPHVEPAAFDPYMPVKNVTPEYPPTLLIHGTADTDVPYEQSVLMERELKRHGVAHRFITVPDAGHGLYDGDPKLVSQAYDEVLPFVERYVKRRD
jgi:acetyl esterase/lipase